MQNCTDNANGNVPLIVKMCDIFSFFKVCSCSFGKKTAYRNFWTLDASVGRWTLEEAGFWTLEASLWTLSFGHWTLLLTGSEQNQNPESDSAWLNYWKLFGCKSLRTHGLFLVNSILTLSVTLKKNTKRNFYCEKSNYIKSSYLGLLRNSRPESFNLEKLFRKHRW